MKKPLLLLILDGFGEAPAGPYNAISLARTPCLDKLFERWPHALLQCSGLAVGLPEGQMGNSEVGHTNLGAGRVVYQELTRISKEIADGDFDRNPALLGAIHHAQQTGGAVHLFGLLSDGGVHSHIEHLFALLELCQKQQVRTYLHCFLDGRDVAPTSGAGFVQMAAEKCAQTGARIATVMGRYYAMDRDKRWDRVELAYNAIALREGQQASDPVQAVRQSYQDEVTDEFVRPVVVDGGAPVTGNDSVIFFNFRHDRARELSYAFVDPAFDGFVRRGGFIGPRYVCFTQYDAAMPNVDVAFHPQTLDNILGQVLADRGMTQLRIAETEKYAHVTFFFNGGREEPYAGEDRVLVPSPKVATYDLKPEMSAYEVADQCIERIESGRYDVIIMNLANCDMVGHTGVLEAAVKAVEAVDTCAGRVVDAVLRAGGAAIVTADHGNADQMCDAQGNCFTAHTVNPVPIILCGTDFPAIQNGALCDVAPTMLRLLDIPQPAEMTGHSLV